MTSPRSIGRALVEVSRIEQALIHLPVPLMGFIYSASEPGQPLERLALLALSCLLLFVHVLVLNNYADFFTDREDPGKRFVGSYDVLTRGGLFGWAAVLLISALALAWTVSARLALTEALIAAIWAAYSLPPTRFKDSWVTSNLTHLVSGILHFAAGSVAARGTIGGDEALFGVFFGLAILAGQLNQDVIDARPDGLAGTRSFAVVFGSRAAFQGSILVFAVTGAQAILLAACGVLPIGAAAILALPNAALVAWGISNESTFRGPPTSHRFVAVYRVAYLAAALLFLPVYLASR